MALTNPSHARPQARGVCAPNSPRVSREVRVRRVSGGADEAGDRPTRTTSLSSEGGPAGAGVGNGARGAAVADGAVLGGALRALEVAVSTLVMACRLSLKKLWATGKRCTGADVVVVGKGRW